MTQIPAVHLLPAPLPAITATSLQPTQIATQTTGTAPHLRRIPALTGHLYTHTKGNLYRVYGLVLTLAALKAGDTVSGPDGQTYTVTDAVAANSTVVLYRSVVTPPHLGWARGQAMFEDGRFLPAPEDQTPAGVRVSFDALDEHSDLVPGVTLWRCDLFWLDAAGEENSESRRTLLSDQESPALLGWFEQRLTRLLSRTSPRRALEQATWWTAEDLRQWSLSQTKGCTPQPLRLPLPSVAAQVHDDGYRQQVSFDAAPYFAQLSDRDLVGYLFHQFRLSKETDDVALFFQGKDARITSFFETKTSGFEASFNEDHLLQFARLTRPHLQFVLEQVEENGWSDADQAALSDQPPGSSQA